MTCQYWLLWITLEQIMPLQCLPTFYPDLLTTESCPLQVYFPSYLSSTKLPSPPTCTSAQPSLRAVTAIPTTAAADLSDLRRRSSSTTCFYCSNHFVFISLLLLQTIIPTSPTPPHCHHYSSSPLEQRQSPHIHPRQCSATGERCNPRICFFKSLLLARCLPPPIGRPLNPNLFCYLCLSLGSSRLESARPPARPTVGFRNHGWSHAQ